MHLLLTLAAMMLLPQEFDRRNHMEAVAFEVDDHASNLRQPTRSTASIVFTANVASGLVTTTQTVTERWLVSEPWCINCPPAKRRFLASGQPADHIISIAEAKRRHGKNINAVPAEYTTTRNVTAQQPPHYRKEWPPQWDVEGVRQPSKAALLSHLRSGGQHGGKHWQQWSLESWSREQLAALHSDDHNGTVPTYTDPDVTAEIDTEPSLNVLTQALQLHLTQGNAEQPVGGLFEITIDTPEQPRKAVADLLTKQRIELNGVSIDWRGGDRTISVGPSSVRITPGCVVEAKRLGVTVRTTLTALRFDEELSWVKLELSGVPDLTVRFQ